MNSSDPKVTKKHKIMKKHKELTSTPQAKGGPRTFTSLPVEILTLFVMELPLQDILKVRSTCRALQRVCGAKQVWKRAFVRSLGTLIPKPFFLSKPLEENSSEELERAMRKWVAPWRPTSPLQQFKRDVATAQLGELYLEGKTLIMTPGGRWILAAHSDGSVWYFDLSKDWTSSAPLEPRLLVPGLPPPTTVTESEDLDIELAIDCTSAEALGSSLQTHSLTQFNMAILVRPLEGGDYTSEPLHADVWRVRVTEGSDGLELQPGEHLSSFTEDPSFGLYKASLYGTILAYVVGVIAIVDWREANGRNKDETLQCRYLSPRLPVQSLHLLPGGRLLVNYDDTYVRLYNWKTDIPLTDFSQSTAVRQSNLPPSVWKFDAPDSTIRLGSQQPLVMGGTVRMVILTAGGVHGLTISVDDRSPDGVQVRPLLKDFFGGLGRRNHMFHINRGVGMRFGSQDLYYAEYCWEGGLIGTSNPRTEHYTIPESSLDDLSGGSFPSPVLYDQFTNRIVVALLHLDAPRFYTIIPSDRTGDEEEQVEAAIDTGTAEETNGEPSGSLDGGARESLGEASQGGASDDEHSRKGDGSGEESLDGELGGQGSDRASESEGSDDEISWKGVGNPGESRGADHGGREPGGAPEEEGGSEDGIWSDDEASDHASAGHARGTESESEDSDEDSGGDYSDGEVSWKGVASDEGTPSGEAEIPVADVEPEGRGAGEVSDRNNVEDEGSDNASGGQTRAVDSDGGELEKPLEGDGEGTGKGVGSRGDGLLQDSGTPPNVEDAKGGEGDQAIDGNPGTSKATPENVSPHS